MSGRFDLVEATPNFLVLPISQLLVLETNATLLLPIALDLHVQQPSRFALRPR